MKYLTSLLLGLLIGTVYADHHGNKVAGMDLSKGNALQMQLCSLKPGKKMSDYEANFDDYIAWSKKHGVETFALRLTPMFVTPPNNGTSIEWIEILASPFSVSGEAWDKWLTTEDGQKLNARWQTLADCRVSVNPVFTLFADPAITAQDTRVMTLNWCTRNPGVSSDQVQARHRSVLAGRTSDSPISAWSISYNGLGRRKAPGDYLHMMSFADNAALMRYMDGYANNEGWRRRQDYETSYASCTGQNAYFVNVLNRP